MQCYVSLCSLITRKMGKIYWNVNGLFSFFILQNMYSRNSQILAMVGEQDKWVQQPAPDPPSLGDRIYVTSVDSWIADMQHIDDEINGANFRFDDNKMKNETLRAIIKDSSDRSLESGRNPTPSDLQRAVDLNRRIVQTGIVLLLPIRLGRHVRRLRHRLATRFSFKTWRRSLLSSSTTPRQFRTRENRRRFNPCLVTEWFYVHRQRSAVVRSPKSRSSGQDATDGTDMRNLQAVEAELTDAAAVTLNCW